MSPTKNTVPLHRNGHDLLTSSLKFITKGGFCKRFVLLVFGSTDLIRASSDSLFVEPHVASIEVMGPMSLDEHQKRAL